jgi:hypothetical protein
VAGDESNMAVAPSHGLWVRMVTHHLAPPKRRDKAETQIAPKLRRVYYASLEGGWTRNSRLIADHMQEDGDPDIATAKPAYRGNRPVCWHNCCGWPLGCSLYFPRHLFQGSGVWLFYAQAPGGECGGGRLEPLIMYSCYELAWYQ